MSQNLYALGFHNYISSLKNDGNFAYAITNKRILMAQKKVIGQIFQTVDVDNLNDITMTTGLFTGIITIDTMKERFNIAVDKQAAQRINDAIHNVLLSVKQQKKALATSHPSNSVADELLKLKSLLDMGAITQEEFDKKKAELL